MSKCYINLFIYLMLERSFNIKWARSILDFFIVNILWLVPTVTYGKRSKYTIVYDIVILFSYLMVK